MSYRTDRKWTLNTSVRKEVAEQLLRHTESMPWWHGSINILTDMVIQLLARGKMNDAEIALFMECSPECVRLIRDHYPKMIEHSAREYKTLNERRYDYVGI